MILLSNNRLFLTYSCNFLQTIFIMNEIIIVVVAIVVLIVGVIVYGVISTTMGSEEDVNKNYVPDRFERMLGKDPKKKEE